MEPKWIVITFLLAWAAALAALLARLGYGIKDDLPPEAPELFRLWRRRRLWTLIAELSTTPAFGAGWTLAAIHWSLSIPVVVGGAMLSGAVGFAFFLNAAHRIIERKIRDV